MRSLIDMAADRGAFIDQSQSLNLFMETRTSASCRRCTCYAWKKGLKTTYYLRSRPATRISKTTVAAGRPPTPPTGGGERPPAPKTRTPTTKPSPARSRTPRPARPASELRLSTD